MLPTKVSWVISIKRQQSNKIAHLKLLQDNKRSVFFYLRCNCDIFGFSDVSGYWNVPFPFPDPAT